MAKIILTSRYLRNASKETLRNYVRYIGTREGVERIPAENKKNPASIRQKQLVRQITAVRAAGKYDSLRVHRFDLLNICFVRINLTVHITFPDTSCDKLIILSAKVKDDH